MQARTSRQGQNPRLVNKYNVDTQRVKALLLSTPVPEKTRQTKVVHMALSRDAWAFKQKTKALWGIATDMTKRIVQGHNQCG